MPTVKDVVELRVHGVGGPQGPKILGWTSTTDVVTLPPIEIPGADGTIQHSPRDAHTRFVRPVVPEPGRPVTEAYEWGGLTMGSRLKALWVVFLPFTLLNVGGWARTQGGTTARPPRHRDVGARFLGYLGTATYVLWLAYLLLELAGTQWRNRIIAGAPPSGDDSVAVVLARCALRPAALALFLGILAVLALVNRQSGRDFEEVNPDRVAPAVAEDPVDLWLRAAHGLAAGAVGACVALVWTAHVPSRAQWADLALSGAVLGALSYQRLRATRRADTLPGDPNHWDDTERAIDKDFFAHHRSLARLRHRHTVFAVGVTGFALALAWTGRSGPYTRLGLAIVGLATIQVTMLVGVWVFGFFHGPERLVRAGLLTLGTVLCHAVFAGLGLYLRQRLASLPAGAGPATPLPVGVELRLNDQFALAFVIAALVLVVAALVPPRPSENAEGVVATVARRVPLVGVLMTLSFVAIFAWFSVSTFMSQPWSTALHAPGLSFHEVPVRWYEIERSMNARDTSTALQTLGSKLLLLLPVAFVLAMRTSTGLSKVVGNIWDVFTFWPRRYHPFAVPPYAERAVPELRARVRTLLDQGDGVILSGHSQGSVLSVAAVAPLLDTPEDRRLHLIVFGSPLGTMFARVFRAALGIDALVDVRDRLNAKGGRWWVLWRKTDPIGGPVFRDDLYADEIKLDDPPPGEGWVNPADVAGRPPLDRPPPWGVKRVHSSYPGEPDYRDAVTKAAALLKKRVVPVVVPPASGPPA